MSGGPEVYPSFEQLEPLKRGVFASVITSTAYVAGALPELNATWFGFGANPAELRAAGLVAALDKVTREKHGVMVLGLPLQMRFNVYLKRPIEDANLSGLKMRSTPIYEPVLKGLGAADRHGTAGRPADRAGDWPGRRLRLAGGRRDRARLCASDQVQGHAAVVGGNRRRFDECQGVRLRSPTIARKFWSTP